MNRGEINLRTCTKEQVRNRIEYMVNNARYNLYIFLENTYIEEPTILFQSCDGPSSFGQIIAGYYGKNENDEYESALIQFEYDENGVFYNSFITSVEKFTDYLFGYIEEKYR